MNELDVIGAGICALVVVLLAMPPAIRLANRWGLLDHPTGWKTHARATPYAGGMVVMLGVTAGVLAFAPRSSFAMISLGLVVALGVLGIVDDARGVSWRTRIVLVAAAGYALWAAGYGWQISPPTWGAIVTILWMLAVVNAINLLDLLDGAAASAAAATGLGVAALGIASGDPVVAATGATLAGACAGFLWFNLADPSRSFLGNGGTMAIGASIAISVPALPLVGAFDGFEALSLAVLVAVVPLADMTYRIVKRLIRRVPLLTAGPDSAANWLQTRLVSARATAAVICGAQAVACATALIIVVDEQTAYAALAGRLFVAAGWAALVWVIVERTIDPRHTAAATRGP